MALLVPIAFTLGVWWLSTGLVLKAIQPSAGRQREALAGASLLLLVGIAGVVVTRDMATPLGAYLAFVAAVMVWAWQEVAFLLGLVTGPNRKPCPPVSGWRKAWHAFTAIAHHELALVLLGAAVLLPSVGAPNSVAAQVWLVLWVMRLSAKLNIFLGVQNFYEPFLPPSLHYLLSYFSRRRFNMLFPFSVGLASIIAVIVWVAAFRTDSAFEEAAFGLVGTLLVLAIVEHWLLVIPMQPQSLWRWALKGRS
ncbi:MAG: putative photosynthetic complex assembly protein PuhE [Betaproteobacteria bacterium]